MRATRTLSFLDSFRRFFASPFLLLESHSEKSLPILLLWNPFHTSQYLGDIFANMSEKSSPTQSDWRHPPAMKLPKLPKLPNLGNPDQERRRTSNFLQLRRRASGRSSQGSVQRRIRTNNNNNNLNKSSSLRSSSSRIRSSTSSRNRIIPTQRKRRIFFRPA